MVDRHAGRTLVLLALLASVGASCRKEPPAAVVDTAMELLKSGSPEEAERMLSEALGRRGDDVELLRARAIVRIGLTDRLRALSDAERVLALNPGDPAALHVRAGAATMLGSPDALAYVDAAAAAGIPETFLSFHRGVALENRKDWEGALAAYRVGIEGGRPSPHVGAGMLLLSLDRNEEAVDVLERGVEADLSEGWSALALVGAGRREALRRVSPRGHWEKQLVAYARGDLSREGLVEAMKNTTHEHLRQDRASDIELVTGFLAESRGAPALALEAYARAAGGRGLTSPMRGWLERRRSILRARLEASR